MQPILCLITLDHNYEPDVYCKYRIIDGGRT
jgi:hypothetical protein